MLLTQARIIRKNKEHAEWLTSERGKEWALKWKEPDTDFFPSTASQHLETTTTFISNPDILSYLKTSVIFMNTFHSEHMG